MAKFPGREAREWYERGVQDGLMMVALRRQEQAWAAYRASVAEYRREWAAARQREAEARVGELVAVLAEAMA